MFYCAYYLETFNQPTQNSNLDASISSSLLRRPRGKCVLIEILMYLRFHLFIMTEITLLAVCIYTQPYLQNILYICKTNTLIKVEKDHGHATKTWLMLGTRRNDIKFVYLYVLQVSLLDDDAHFRYILKQASTAKSSPTFHLIFSLSQPVLPVLWVRLIPMEGTPLLFVWIESNPFILVHRLSVDLVTYLYHCCKASCKTPAAPAPNRQSLQTSGNLYTPISGHRRCISNCQCALPDALLSFDPIHSSGCVPVAVIYTPCDFTDV